MLHTASQFDGFPTTFTGPLFRPDDDGYDLQRTIWNMRLDGIPGLIVQPRTVDDVVTAVTFAAQRDIPIAIHSGGHGIDGFSMPDGALVIDNRQLTGLSFDPETSQVTMQAGVRLGQLDAFGQQHGVVVPAGVVSDTGAAGLTLGGGIGHNVRRFGATVDNLLTVELVTADGRVVNASRDQNPELFWGLRGAGQNLGVVTSFTYQAHQLGPQVMSGMLIYSVADAARLFDGIDEVMAAAPRELAVTFQVVPNVPMPGQPAGPPDPTLVTALVVYTGDLGAYEAAISGVLALATPLANLVAPSTWVETNRIVDQFNPPARRYHQLGGYLRGLNAEIARIAIDAVTTAPTSEPGASSCTVTFPILGGKLLDADEGSTAFSREGAEWLFESTAQWVDRQDDEVFMQWATTTFEALRPFATTNAYTNLSAHQGAEWLRAAYGSAEKWKRIVRLKQEWDPENRFSFNKNVTRAVDALPATDRAN